jgi:hypothetical protein
MSRGETVYPKFMRQYVCNPSQMNGKDITGGGRNGGYYRFVYVRDSKLYSFGSHYLMCMFKEGVALVNSARYSQCTTAQLKHLHDALDSIGARVLPFHNIGKDEELPEGGPGLRNILAPIEDTLVTRLVSNLGKPWNIGERCLDLLNIRKNPDAIIGDILSSTVKEYLEKTEGTSDLGELLAKCKESDLPDLLDVYRMVNDVNHVPKTRAGKAAGLLLGRQKTYPYVRFHNMVEAFLNDLENFGIEVAAVNLAPLDGGAVLATL